MTVQAKIEELAALTHQKGELKVSLTKAQQIAKAFKHVIGDCFIVMDYGTRKIVTATVTSSDWKLVMVVDLKEKKCKAYCRRYATIQG